VSSGTKLAAFAVNIYGTTNVRPWETPGVKLTLDSLPINLFDVLVLAVLTAGIVRGRKHGMSEELISLLQWVAILLGCAALYEQGAQMFGEFSRLFSQLTRYLMAYAAAALLIVIVFAGFKRLCRGKLLGSDTFGRSEYYLGMASGFVRFGCMLLVGLALLNARYFSPTEVRALERYNEDVYGKEYWPSLHTIQEVVFEKSVTGPLIKQHLGFLLIKPTAPEDKQLHQKEFVFP
jgi:uncharacterized membrane protein required for colicin V production